MTQFKPIEEVYPECMRESFYPGGDLCFDALDTCERCGRLPEIASRELYRQDRDEYAAVCPRCGWRTEWHCSVEETVAAWDGM